MFRLSNAREKSILKKPLREQRFFYCSFLAALDESIHCRFPKVSGEECSLTFPRRVSGKSSLAVDEIHGKAEHKISSRVSDDANMFSCVAMGDAVHFSKRTVGFTHG